MENADGSSPSPVPLEDDIGSNNFDGNADWAPDGSPDCPDDTVTTQANTPITIELECTDTGPAYERTDPSGFVAGDGVPQHGATSDDAPTANPSTVSPGFTGIDRIGFTSFDAFGFGSDKGTVTITVTAPAGGGGGGSGDAGSGGGRAGGGAPVACAGKTATIVGTPGNDALLGTSRADVIVTGAGNDTVRAGRGNDIVCGGTGRDICLGGGGRDRASCERERSA